MKAYMLDLLNKIGEDKGKTINYLIDTEVLTKNYIIKQAIATKDRPRTLYDAYTLYNIALYVKNLTNDDKEKIADTLISMGNFDILCEFAANIQNAPIDKIANAIITKGESKYIFRLAICIKENKYYIKKLMKEIINLKDSEYIYLFSRDLFPYLENIDIDSLADAIIETNDLEYIYEFANNNTRTPIYKLALAIIKSENEEYIGKLKRIPNAPKDINLMIEREKLKKQSEYSQLTELNALIELEQPENIQYNADIYRKLFVETEEEEKEIEREIKSKKRVLSQGMNAKPQFPGERKLKK